MSQQEKQISFKEHMRESIIPFVKKLIDSEEKHLEFLISKKAIPHFINTSKKHLEHFKTRLVQYEEYVKN